MPWPAEDVAADPQLGLALARLAMGLDGLYRRRRIDLVHARIMRIWGERQATPNPAFANERCDWRLWRESMERLDWPLRVKGIIA